MSFIRGAVITVFGLVLSVCLLLTNLSVTLASSLQYDSLQPALKSSASGLMGGFLDTQGIFSEQYKNEIQNYCLIDKEYVLSYGNQTLSIPCKVIEQGKDSVVNYVADSVVNQIYYTDYNCDFWECVNSSEVPFVLISDKARLYWTGKAILLAVMSLVLFILIFLVSDSRPGKFIGTGVLLILYALPFRNLNWLLKLLPGEVSPIVSLLSGKANMVFIIMLIIGVSFILIGIVSKIFGWKMKLKDDEPEVNKSTGERITKSDVRKIVKEELSKKNVSKPKGKKKN